MKTIEELAEEVIEGTRRHGYELSPETAYAIVQVALAPTPSDLCWMFEIERRLHVKKQN